MSILARHGIFQPVRSQGVYCSDNVSSGKNYSIGEKFPSKALAGSGHAKEEKSSVHS